MNTLFLIFLTFYLVLGHSQFNNTVIVSGGQ